MYKASKFNHIYEKENKLCIYNALSGAIAKSEDKNIKNILLSERISNDNPYIEKMLEDGFIVRDDVDEDLIAELRHLDMVANKNLKLILLPTTSCNFRCIYCYTSFINKRMDQSVKERIVKYVKKNINDFNSLNIDWFGGEPLLEIDTINELSKEFISICHERGKRYIASMTTNGYFLTENVFRKMLENRIGLFMITLDGFKEMHNKSRKLVNGCGSFDKILDNLRNIRDNVKSSYFKIRIRVNITRDLVPRMDEYIKFLYDEFGKDKRFNFHFAAVNNYGGEAIKLINGSLLDSFDDVYNAMINSQYQLDYRVYYGFLQNQRCYSGRRNMYVINPEGKVKKCTVLEDPSYDVGYINESGNMVVDEYKLAKWVIYKMSNNSVCNSCNKNIACSNFACPMIHNFPDNNVDCGRQYFNLDKIIDLLTNNNSYNFIKQY